MSWQSSVWFCFPELEILFSVKAEVLPSNLQFWFPTQMHLCLCDQENIWPHNTVDTLPATETEFSSGVNVNEWGNALSCLTEPDEFLKTKLLINNKIK